WVYCVGRILELLGRSADGPPSQEAFAAWAPAPPEASPWREWRLLARRPHAGAAVAVGTCFLKLPWLDLFCPTRHHVRAGKAGRRASRGFPPIPTSFSPRQRQANFSKCLIIHCGLLAG